MNWSGKCEGPGGGDRWDALCTGFTLVYNKSKNTNTKMIKILLTNGITLKKKKLDANHIEEEVKVH